MFSLKKVSLSGLKIVLRTQITKKYNCIRTRILEINFTEPLIFVRQSWTLQTWIRYLDVWCQLRLAYGTFMHLAPYWLGHDTTCIMLLLLYVKSKVHIYFVETFNDGKSFVFVRIKKKYFSFSYFVLQSALGKLLYEVSSVLYRVNIFT